MSIDISMHQCDVIRVRTHHPNNGNSVTLQIKGDDGDIRLTLYGLPIAITERLLHEFSDDKTSIDHECGRKPQPEAL